MPVQEQVPYTNHTGNGVTTAFSYTFKLIQADDLRVTLDDVEQIGGYTVDGLGNDAGGTVTFLTAPTNNVAISLQSDVELERETDYQENGDLLAQTQDDDFDRIWLALQGQGYWLRGAVRAPFPEQIPALPKASARANKFLVFDASGNPQVANGSGTDSGLRDDLANETDPTLGVGLLGYVSAYTGAGGRSLSEKLAESVSVTDFFANGVDGDLVDPTGVVDSTLGFQAAINTGRKVFVPDGTYKITDELSLATKGQQIQGESKYNTVLNIDAATFNMAADGVFNYIAGEPGFVLRDFTIKFVQPDSAVRGDYNQYPPAIKATAQPRFVVEDLRILHAWDGISMKGNSGGASILNLDLFTYNTGLDIDGALDSIRIDRLHWYNFEATANQIAVFYNTLNIGLRIGRADDIHIHDCLFIGGQAIYFYDSGLGGAFGNITNTDFDTNTGIVMSAGDIAGSALFFSVSADGKRAINISGGRLKIAAVDFTNAAELTTNSLVEVGPNASNAVLEIVGFTARLTGDTRAFEATSAGAGIAYLTLIGGRIERRDGAAETRPSILLSTNSRGTLIGNTMSSKNSGSGNWVQVTSDGSHNIVGNTPNGWTASLPAVAALMNFSGNIGNHAWAAFATVLSSGTGAITSATAAMQFERKDKTVNVRFQIDITTNGTGASSLSLTLPYTALGNACGAGRELLVTGKQVSANAYAGTNTLSIQFYDNTYAGSNGARIVGSITYEAA